MGKRILNWGWYGFNNFGDDLLVRAIISNIKTPDRELFLR